MVKEMSLTHFHSPFHIFNPAQCCLWQGWDYAGFTDTSLWPAVYMGGGGVVSVFFFFFYESVSIYFPIFLQWLLPDRFKLLPFHCHSSCKHISCLQVNIYWKRERGETKVNITFCFGLKKIWKNREHKSTVFAVRLLSAESTGRFSFQSLVEAWEKSRWHQLCLLCKG